MKSFKINDYDAIITYDQDDRIYVSEVPELPGCMAHGDTQEEAVAETKNAIESWKMAAEALIKGE